MKMKNHVGYAARATVKFRYANDAREVTLSISETAAQAIVDALTIAAPLATSSAILAVGPELQETLTDLLADPDVVVVIPDAK